MSRSACIGGNSATSARVDVRVDVRDSGLESEGTLRAEYEQWQGVGWDSGTAFGCRACSVPPVSTGLIPSGPMVNRTWDRNDDNRTSWA